MACITPEGNITATAKELLRLLQDKAATVEDLSGRCGQPLYLVRSNLRQLLEAGLILAEGGQYSITEAGKQVLK